MANPIHQRPFIPASPATGNTIDIPALAKKTQMQISQLVQQLNAFISHPSQIAERQPLEDLAQTIKALHDLAQQIIKRQG